MTQQGERLRPKPVEERCRLVGNAQVGPGLWDMELAAPRIAAAIGPGQFVHLQVPGMGERILRRPFSVYDADAQAGTLRILYQVVGKGSTQMTRLRPASDDAQAAPDGAGAPAEGKGAGTVGVPSAGGAGEAAPALSLMGPLGAGWLLPEGARRVLFVLGGVGAAPLAMFGRKLVRAGVALDVCMGAQTRDALVLLRHYQDQVGVDPLCATDDGSFGHAGFVTGPAEQMLRENDYDLVCCCGPEPLMRAAAGLAAEAGVPCEVSLEKRMACGIGACLSCVVNTVDGRRRSCVDGPVFDARKVVW